MISETVIERIVAFIFGHRYYANIVRQEGTCEPMICSFIFGSMDDAERHRRELLTNRSYRYMETVSFRSRKEY